MGKVMKKKYTGAPSIKKWITNEGKTYKVTTVISKALMNTSI